MYTLLLKSLSSSQHHHYSRSGTIARLLYSSSVATLDVTSRPMLPYKRPFMPSLPIVPPAMIIFIVCVGDGSDFHAEMPRRSAMQATVRS